jgi:hypothetical protein
MFDRPNNPAKVIIMGTPKTSDTRFANRDKATADSRSSGFATIATLEANFLIHKQDHVGTI